MTVPTSRATDLPTVVSISAGYVLRYGLVVPLAWIGIQKFTTEEANAIMPLIAHQPLMSWLYDVLGVQALSNVLGAVEIVAALLIAIKPMWATASAIGSGIATLLFLATISFLFTTPGVVADSPLHLPLLTADGAFLIKDLVLLGAALWTLGDALQSRASRGAFDH